MKLLVYSPLSLRFGGGFERWILEVTSRLKEFKVCTKIICTKSTVGDTERISSETIQRILNEVSVEYFEVPYISFPIGSSNSPIPTIKALKKIIATTDFDILYFANAYAFQDFTISILKYIHKKPVISGQHAVMFQKSHLHNMYINTLGKVLAKTYNAHHVLNTQDKQIFEKWGLKRVYFIPIGVDTQRFSPNKRKKDHAKFKVLFVGRLTFQKGVDILCESIKMINESVFQEKLEFLIVGSGNMEPLVQEVTQQYKNVKYLGQVTDEALTKIYSNSNLLVMPSRRETFGIVALEAQACGLPVITSNIAGPKDIVINNTTGTVIPVGDYLALASQIESYYFLWLRNYEKYKGICIKARQNVLDHYDWSIITKRMYNMLTNVLEPINANSTNV